LLIEANIHFRAAFRRALAGKKYSFALAATGRQKSLRRSRTLSNRNPALRLDMMLEAHQDLGPCLIGSQRFPDLERKRAAAIDQLSERAGVDKVPGAVIRAPQQRINDAITESAPHQIAAKLQRPIHSLLVFDNRNGRYFHILFAVCTIFRQNTAKCPDRRHRHTDFDQPDFTAMERVYGHRRVGPCRLQDLSQR
jgi:hypothetical protein